MAKKKKRKPQKLDKARKRLQKYVDKANKLWNQLMEVNPSAPALWNAMMSKSMAKGVNQDQYFSVSELHRTRELEREASRLKAFLSEGGQQLREMQDPDYKYLFKREGFSAFSGHYVDESGEEHNYWKEKYGVTYDITRVDSKWVKMAWDIYRRLEESDPYLIYGEGAYGSEKLIVAIYNMMTLGSYRDRDEMYADVLENAAAMLAAKDEQKKREAALAMTKEDYGRLDRAMKGRW